MSVETAAIPQTQEAFADAHTRHVLRYALGATIAMAAATSIPLYLSYLIPVLTIALLARPGGPPSLREGIGFVGTVVVACYVALVVTRYTLLFPAIFFLGFAVTILWIFYAMSGGFSPFVALWLMLAVTVLPLIAVQSPQIASDVTRNLISAAVWTLAVVWVAHALVPDPASATESAPKKTRPALDVRRRAALALAQTAVVMPLFIAFHLLEGVDSLLALIYVGILAMQPQFARDFKTGAALILANVVGGFFTLIAYELLVIAPSYLLLLLLTFLAGLGFGSRLLSSRKGASLYGTAFSTWLLLVGSLTTSSDNAATEVYSRVLLILAAVVYVVIASGLVSHFLKAREA